MSRAVACLALVAAVVAEPDPAAAQYGTASVPAETVCRAAPQPSADAVGMLEAGDLVLVYQGVSTSAGQWTRITAGTLGRFGVPDGCWVPSSDVVPARGTGHFLQLADGLLSATVSPTLDELLAVHNLFGHPWYREEVEASPVLGLRRLQLLRAALRPLGPRDADALTLAWIRALEDEVSLAQEGHAWTVSDEAYLNLYEKHRSGSFAEEIMWAYASESGTRNCEGEFACDVREAVNNRLARYWTDFPAGRHIAEAVEAARTVIGHGLESCKAARGRETDSREARIWRWSGWDRSGAEITQELRVSLEAVSDEDKAPLLEQLAELEACAA
ncbi:MAG: hypothetical protein OXU74_14460 [Gemmatimonadota bacterium]|nr:hypothetical protein [Gemmatimonadota bacterium]